MSSNFDLEELNNFSKINLNSNIVIFEEDNRKYTDLDKKVKHTLLLKLYDFINKYCILNVNVDNYVCTKCNKTLGCTDFLYYENGIKYIITEKYYHTFKEHEIVIDDKLYQLL
jgi:hypothetical protein